MVESKTKSKIFQLWIYNLIWIGVIAFLVILFFYDSSQPSAIDASPLPASNQIENSTKLDLSFKGVTLFASKKSSTSYLLNHDYSIIKTWDLKTERIKLLPNCNLLYIRKDSDLNKLEEIDWNGNLIKIYDLNTSPHHDFFITEDSVFAVTENKVVYKENKFQYDIIKEITSDDQIKFSWSYLDYFQPGTCMGTCVYEHYSKNNTIDWTHTNAVSIIPENRHYDQGDLRFKPGNILTSPRNWNTVLLIEKETGKIIWSYVGKYNGGLEGSHDVQMIAKGLPGAGNIIMLDNGDERMKLSKHTGESYILEIDPTTKEIVWVYDAGVDFYTFSGGIVQRLPNGNTFIGEDVKGRMFEVTPEKNIVWQYKLADARSDRPRRYGYDYCPLLEQYRSYSTQAPLP